MNGAFCIWCEGWCEQKYSFVRYVSDVTYKTYRDVVCTDVRTSVHSFEFGTRAEATYTYRLKRGRNPYFYEMLFVEFTTKITNHALSVRHVCTSVQLLVRVAMLTQSELTVSENPVFKSRV